MIGQMFLTEKDIEQLPWGPRVLLAVSSVRRARGCFHQVPVGFDKLLDLIEDSVRGRGELAELGTTAADIAAAGIDSDEYGMMALCEGCVDVAHAAEAKDKRVSAAKAYAAVVNAVDAVPPCGLEHAIKQEFDRVRARLLNS